MKRLQYEDRQGKKRFWESAERSTRRGEVDAVAVYARCVSSKCDEEQIVLVSQFRPPVDNTVLELPAGLVDEGETASEAALRELREETGLVGQAVSESETIYSDPGMSNCNMKVVEVLVDMDRNQDPKQNLEDGEDIVVHMVGTNNLQESLQRLSEKEGHVIDARLWAIAFGYTTYGKTAGAREAVSFKEFLQSQTLDKQMLYFTSAVFLTSAVVTAGLVKAFSSR